MNHPYYSLFCKQSELQQPWESPWGCGFAALITCFRILGDRVTENAELINRFRATGQKPQDGMSSEDAIAMARALGYQAALNPTSTNQDREAFIEWMRSKWRRGIPVMLSIASRNDGGESDHWWVAYGNTEESNIWIMCPSNDNVPFQCKSISEIMGYASCDYGDGCSEYDAVAISAAAGSDLVGIPPSVALFEFLNSRQMFGTGWNSHAIAAALVDNHFASITDLDSEGRATGRSRRAIVDLLTAKGPVTEVIESWDAFFTDRQKANMELLRSILEDVEAHCAHKIAAKEEDRMVREIALNLILIGTSLMDG